MSKLNKKKIFNAIPGSEGVYSTIAYKCNVSRSALTQFLNKEENQDLKESIKLEKEMVLDLVESELMELIKKGNFRAIKYFLTTRGKSRGYGPEVIKNKPIGHSDLKLVFK